MIELHFSITSNEIKDYAEASGDYNPIHLDENYAREQGFSGNIAHGMLTMAKIWSVISSHLLTSNDFPESYELAFLSPVYAGGDVTLQLEPQPNGFLLEGFCNKQAVVKGFIHLDADK